MVRFGWRRILDAMFGFFKRTHKDLIKLLEEVDDLLTKNDNISLFGLSAAEGSMDLRIAIEGLKAKRKIDKKHIKSLFAPTGLIQECAMANGWADQYLELSDRFDELIVYV